MPEPITAPMPKAVRLHGPRVLLSFFSGSSDAAISASMLFVRKMLTSRSWRAAAGERPACLKCGRSLALALALRLVTDLFLLRPASHAGGALRLGCGLLPRCALELLTFCLVGDVLGIHQFLFSPAYFSTSFFRPKRGK